MAKTLNWFCIKRDNIYTSNSIFHCCFLFCWYYNQIQENHTPIFVAACTKDDLAPADKTIELAKQCKTSTCKTFNCGHFEVYYNDFFEEAIIDYIEFYNNIFA